MKALGKIDRSSIFDRFTAEEICERYKKNYGIAAVSIEQVRHHADLEGALTDRILASSSDERGRVVSDAYSTLYREIDWLVSTGGQSDGEVWLSLMHPGAVVYEIGSGSGRLANYLNQHGVQCTRTDISAERNSVAGDGMTAVTDGVNLSEFTDIRYDYVISDQVVEHLHPDDIFRHFSECKKILKPGGSYIVRAPNRFLGPCDLSRVFGTKEAIFMHLHEFQWQDVREIAKTCRYRTVQAVFKLPKTRTFIKSAWYYRYLLSVEGMIERSEDKAGIARRLYYPSQVWFVLTP